MYFCVIGLKVKLKSANENLFNVWYQMRGHLLDSKIKIKSQPTIKIKIE